MAISVGGEFLLEILDYFRVVAADNTKAKNLKIITTTTIAATCCDDPKKLRDDLN